MLQNRESAIWPIPDVAYSTILSIPYILEMLRNCNSATSGELELEEIRIRATEYLENGLRDVMWGQGAREIGRLFISCWCLDAASVQQDSGQFTIPSENKGSE